VQNVQSRLAVSVTVGQISGWCREERRGGRKTHMNRGGWNNKERCNEVFSVLWYIFF